jgi:hypothetical protein
MVTHIALNRSLAAGEVQIFHDFVKDTYEGKVRLLKCGRETLH